MIEIKIAMLPNLTARDRDHPFLIVFFLNVVL